MVLTLWLLGREVISFSTEAAAHTEEQVTRTIGFASAELAEPYYPPER